MLMDDSSWPQADPATTVSLDPFAIAFTVRALGNANNTGDGVGDRYVLVEGLIGSSFNDELNGDPNAKTLRGGNGNDVLWSREGDDTLDGGAGNDILNGGDGDDTALYTGLASAYTVQNQGTYYAVSTKATGRSITFTSSSTSASTTG